VSINIGSQLGSYEITALLDKGGMGEVYCARDTKLKREVAIKILPDDASNGRGGSWSRGGIIVFAPTNNPALLRVSSAGGASSPVSTGQGSFPFFLPDGQHFLYQQQDSVSGGFPIRVGSLNGSTDKAVGSGSNPLYAQGHLLFLREDTLMAQPFDLESLTTTGEGLPVAEQVQSVLGSGRAGASRFPKAGCWLIGKEHGARPVS
jgi:serine/threonine protein kinase